MATVPVLGFNYLLASSGQVRISPFWNPLAANSEDPAQILAWTVQNRIGIALVICAIMSLGLHARQSTRAHVGGLAANRVWLARLRRQPARISAHPVRSVTRYQRTGQRAAGWTGDVAAIRQLLDVNVSIALLAETAFSIRFCYGGWNMNCRVFCWGLLHAPSSSNS